MSEDPYIYQTHHVLLYAYVRVLEYKVCSSGASRFEISDRAEGVDFFVSIFLRKMNKLNYFSL